jgi:hypothetical protein
LQLFHDVKIAQLQATAMTFDAAWRACDATEAWPLKQLLMAEFKRGRSTDDHNRLVGSGAARKKRLEKG